MRIMKELYYMLDEEVLCMKKILENKLMYVGAATIIILIIRTIIYFANK